MSAQLLSRITGTVLVVPGEKNNLPTENQNKLNIGLNLKFNKKVIYKTIHIVSFVKENQSSRS